MGKPILIIVTGAPGTGKTTLSERVAERFRLPLINKDGIKETLLDSLGANDREESKRLGVPSYMLLYHFLESLMQAGNSSIIESNFKPEYDSERLHLIKKYSFTPLQVFCSADEEIILERYKERGHSGTRHPGHFDDIAYSDLEKDLLKGSYKPLDIGGEVIHIDTSDFDKVDHDSLYAKISAYLPSTA